MRRRSLSMRRPTAAAAAACGEPCPRVANITLFSRVTLISKVQSTSDLDYFHARDLRCSRVKSRDDPISGRRGDSAVPYCFIYINGLEMCIACLCGVVRKLTGQLGQVYDKPIKATRPHHVRR